MKKNQLKGCGVASWQSVSVLDFAPLRTSQVKVGLSADLGDGKDDLA